MPVLVFAARDAREARLLAVRMARAVRWSHYRLDPLDPVWWTLRPEEFA